MAEFHGIFTAFSNISIAYREGWVGWAAMWDRVGWDGRWLFEMLHISSHVVANDTLVGNRVSRGMYV